MRSGGSSTTRTLNPDRPVNQAVGGTLLVVGHDHADSHSTAHAPQPASIGTNAVTEALDPIEWDVAVAETRTRQVTRGSTELTIADLVVRAQRIG
jgi:hypothetical protein